MELIFNKNLRNNYFNALKLTSDSECKEFLADIDKRSRKELFLYIDAREKCNRKKLLCPNTEYFLQHYKEYMTDAEREIFTDVEREWNIIPVVIIVIAYILTLLMG